MKMKYSTLFVSVILLTGLTAAQTTSSQNSQVNAGLTPDSPFYAVEQFVEKIEVAVAKAPVIGSEELEAKVRANNAAERLSEAEKMADKGKNNSKKVERLFEEYDRQMEMSSNLANKSGNPELSSKLNEVQEQQVQQLGQLREKLPEESRKGIDKAIENAEKRRDQRSKPNTGQGLPENRETREQLENKTDPRSEKPDRNGETGNLSRQTGEDSLNENLSGRENTSLREKKQDLNGSSENNSLEENQITGKAPSAPFR